MEVMITEALTKADYEAMKWEDESQSDSHPTKVVLIGNEVRDRESGEVIAVVSPKYRLYWSHSHTHFALANWDGLKT